MDVDDLIQSLFAPPGAPASPPVSPVRNDVFLPSSPASTSTSSTTALSSSSGTDRLLAFVDAQANVTPDSAMDWAADLTRPDALTMDLDLDLDLDAYLQFPAAPSRAASPAPLPLGARSTVKSPSLMTRGQDAQAVGPNSTAPVPATKSAAAPPVTTPVAKAAAPNVAPAALAAAAPVVLATTAAKSTVAVSVAPAASQVATSQAAAPAAATVTTTAQPETDATRLSPAPRSQPTTPTSTTTATPTPTLPAFSATNAAAIPPVPPLPLYSPYWMTPAAAASPYPAGPYAAAAVAAAAAAAAGGMFAPPPASFPYASLYGMLPPPPTPTGMLGPAAWRAAAPDTPLDGLVVRMTIRRAPKPARDAAALLATPPDQLSPDDKKALRKIKNRLAASESRKRAREHVELLEMEVAKLKDEKSALQAQVQQVLDDHARLVQDHDRVLAQLRLLRDAHAYFQVATGTNTATVPMVPFTMTTPQQQQQQASSLVHITAGPAIKSFGALFAIVVLGAAWLLPALSALAPNASASGSAPLSLTASPAAFRSALELVAAAAAPNAGSTSTGTGKAGSAMPYVATTAGGVKVMVLDAPRRSDVVAVSAADNTADPMDLDDDVPSLPAPDARVLYLGDGKDGEHRDQAVVVTVVHSEEGAGGALPALSIKLSDDGTATGNGPSLQIKVEPASDADAAMCRATAASLLTAATAETERRPPRPAAADNVRPKQEEGGAMPPHSFLIHVEPPSPTAARAGSTGPGDALPPPPVTVPSPHAPLHGKSARGVDEGGVRVPAPPTDSGRVFVRGPGSKLA
ncbi:hypothetical protein AMAG_17686 [Allomyces macrogynus ATCC 38327]|uniref:BZIP domain-containing protein n=1 Tax=Allomyces macrogynus (strain ATCC 38327) TaxID=578462 RepID=A0A0L0RW31_ALLM3|nr:hypothetical protein AMAG_17686 [Allomyces macrogynus ATCC 38327]|eukprot:KNE54607.1 hypothetical protein AMAG_17686 [Allomyces macrogynus ATCC 38327]